MTATITLWILVTQLYINGHLQQTVLLCDPPCKPYTSFMDCSHVAVAIEPPAAQRAADGTTTLWTVTCLSLDEPAKLETLP